MNQYMSEVKPRPQDDQRFAARRPDVLVYQSDILTDDLVMATVLAVRMLMVLQEYHADLDKQMKDHADKIIDPMPFLATFH